MGLFWKKPKEVINWVNVEFTQGASVGFMIKNILYNRKQHGDIYIDGEKYTYSYGNLEDIVPSALLEKPCVSFKASQIDGDHILYSIESRKE